MDDIKAQRDEIQRQLVFFQQERDKLSQEIDLLQHKARE